MADQETFTMIFADGTEIIVHSDGAGNWLSDDVTEEILTAENLSEVTIFGEGMETVLTDQYCQGLYPYNDTYGFCLRDKTVEEKMSDMMDLYADAIAELAELIGGE